MKPWLLAVPFLMALFGSPLLASAEQPAVVKTLTLLTNVRSAIDRHQRNTGQLPKSATEVGTAVRIYLPGIAQRQGVPVDAWGKPLRYQPPAEPGGDYVLYSVGKNSVDEQAGGDDVESRTQLNRDLYSDLRQVPGGAVRLLPALLVLAVAPFAWAAIRWAKRISA